MDNLAERVHLRTAYDLFMHCTNGGHCPNELQEDIYVFLTCWRLSKIRTG